MGKHSAPRRRKRSFFKRYGSTVLLSVAALVPIVALICLIVSCSNPYRQALRREGVEVEVCKMKKDVLYLSFEGDVEGILSCRKALSALRANTPPETVAWTLTEEGEEILTGRVERAGYLPPREPPRVETLTQEMTILKLKYQLLQSGLPANVTVEPTVGESGKTVKITLNTTKEDLLKSESPIFAAVKSVNEEGGGIVCCNVIFREDETPIAAVSYDLRYGDTLYSSLFRQE